MNEVRRKAILLLAFFVLVVTPFCHKSPKIVPQAKNVMIEIKAPKAKVFELTSLVFMKQGLTIINANDALGLITTDFKNITKAGWLAGFAMGFSGQTNLEFQLMTNIIERQNISTLTIMAKGRTQSKKLMKLGAYRDYVFDDEFMNGIRKIGEEIKSLAEEK